MNTNIEISKIKTHVLLEINNEPYKNDSKIKKERETKIKNKNFLSVNEVNISNIINKIPYYYNNYIIIEDFDFINIGQLNDKTIEKLNMNKINIDKKYLLINYRNKNIIYFNDFLFSFEKPKKLIFYLINVFPILLQNLIKLQKNSICFFNLSYDNIVFAEDCRENPLLQDFQLSLQISKLNEEYIKNIINSLNDYTLKPIEIHILFYLIKKDIKTISSSFIEEICEVYMKNLNILFFFSDCFKEKYKLACVQVLQKYINKSKKDIINDIIKKNDKWDIYSLSHLFLYIFGNIIKCFSLKGTFINKFVLELSKNIHPDSSKRSNLEDLLNNFNTLLESEKDWSFVNNVEDSKIIHLFEILSQE